MMLDPVCVNAVARTVIELAIDTLGRVVAQ
jgi:hypothetical protein